ncbi:MAG: DUF4124 domain-containing protein [Betaproteobacteria bacterium]
MSKILVLLMGLALAGVAQAQIKCWTTADGKRSCGDAPPAGAKVTTVRGASAPPDGAPAAAASAKDAPKKGPQTAAEKEQDYRKRQADAQKAAAKAELEQQDVAAKKENCANSRATLRSLESGERIQRTDAKGERYIMEDAQREQETAKARTQVLQNCG